MKFYGGKPPPKDPDILLMTFPRRSPHIYYATQLPEALARLKASVEAAGFSSYCLDLDNQYFGTALYSRAIMDELEDYFREVIPRKYFQQKFKLSKETLEWYDDYLNKAVDMVININPKWVGMSIFSEQSIRASLDFLELLKVKAPDIKIVAGGYCMNIWPYFTRGVENPKKFGPWILEDLKLVDYFISGEGEHSLVKLLNGNTTYPGINNLNPKQIEDLDELPIPDYSDFNFAKYVFPDPNNLPELIMPMLSVTGSRGCVRNCIFCDINAKWPKFRWVSPKNLVKEVKKYYKKYGISRFHWSDSLVNASPPMLEQFCDELIKWNKKQDYKPTFSGQFIVKGERQAKPELWTKMKNAGFHRIMVGVEAGSPAVRWEMQKKFSQEDLYYTIEQALANDITIELLMIIGYPTETHSQFLMTKELMDRYKDHAGKVIFSLSSFGMEYDADETPLNINPAMHGIEFDEVLGWKSPVTNNYQALKRTTALWKYMEKLGYPVYNEWATENDEEVADVEEKLRAANREAEIIGELF